MYKSFQESKAEDGRKNSNVLQLQNTRLREKIKKQSRTHALLVSIVVVFALSWFPLNVLNIILDIHNIFEVNVSIEYEDEREVLFNVYIGH